MCKHVYACAYMQNIYAAIFGNDNVRKTGMVGLVCEQVKIPATLQHYYLHILPSHHILLRYIRESKLKSRPTP